MLKIIISKFRPRLEKPLREIIRLFNYCLTRESNATRNIIITNRGMLIAEISVGRVNQNLNS